MLIKLSETAKSIVKIRLTLEIKNVARYTLLQKTSLHKNA